MTTDRDGSLAITSMAGRFAGAADTDELWDLLLSGREGIRTLGAADLDAAGVGTERLDPDFVARSGDLRDVERFDAARFGIASSEAALMDPQIRHLLELAWEAIEGGGYRLDEIRRGAGVYVGVGYNTYLARNLLSRPEVLRSHGWFGLRHAANDKDFAATTLAYRLDLRGPALSVQTACSTSLSALHLACQALLSFECDVALAGAATIEVPAGAGYRYVPGEVLSRDGYCRPFDAEASGTVLTSGAGLVVVRRLADAIDDGDPILAVIRGTAINNDGQRKVSYFAPSVEGQVEVVRDALSVAGVDPASVSMIETHGTGTALGDPIELAALAEALGSSGRDEPVIIGSVKANVGHTDTAAGMASLIKVVESLRRRTITPQANFAAPSTHIDLGGAGLRVVTSAQPWAAAGPRRAGVTSLGVGGTNAHVVVEESPLHESAPAVDVEGEPTLLLLSAPSTGGVTDLAVRLAHTLTSPTVERPTLGAAASTLARSRSVHAWRTAVSTRSAAGAAAALRNGLTVSASPQAPARVVFVFPGAGPQRSAMIAGLLRGADERFGVFRDAAAEAIAAVRAGGGPDLESLLRSGPDATVDAELRRPSIGLPALFVAEYAVARQLMAWGVVPSAVIGHSTGEHAATVIAGAMSVADAATGVLARAEAITAAASSSTAVMTAVFASEAELAGHVDDTLDLAVRNAAGEVVFSGAESAMAAFEARLARAAIEHRRINLAAAAHYRGLDPYLDRLVERMARTAAVPPSIAMYSTSTGARLSTAPDAAYWRDEVRGCVRFADAVAAAWADGPFAAVEIGPGRTLSASIRATARDGAVIASLASADHTDDPSVQLLAAAGRVWALGGPLDVDRVVRPVSRRVRLPVPRLDGPRAWIDAPPRLDAPDVAPGPQFAEPMWAAATASPVPVSGPWRVVGAVDSIGDAVLAEFRRRNVVVADAETPSPAGVLVLASELDGPEALVHSMAMAANALVETSPTGRVAVLTVGAWDDGALIAQRLGAMGAGVASVVASEYPGFTGLALDIDRSAVQADVRGAARHTVAALLDQSLGPVVRVTSTGLLRRDFVVRPMTARTDEAAATDRGRGETALVIGGLGHLGAMHAQSLCREGYARVVVTSRHELVAPTWLQLHGPGNPDSVRLRRFQSLVATAGPDTVIEHRALGPDQLDDVLAEIEPSTVVLAVGTLRDRLLAQLTPEDVAAVLHPKLDLAVGLRAWAEGGDDRSVLLLGSGSTAMGLPGQAAYIAVNTAVEALAGPVAHRTGSSVRALAWGRFADGGMGVAIDVPNDARPVEHPVFHLAGRLPDGSHVAYATTTAEGLWVLDEHRVGGRAVLPATGHLALLLGACAIAGLPARLADVAFIEPLTVPMRGSIELRVVLDPDDQTIRTVRLEARATGSTSWIVHSQARVLGGPVQCEGSVPPRGASSVVDVLGHQRTYLQVGAHWSIPVSVGESEHCGSIDVEQSSTVSPAWIVHPAVLDLAIAAGLHLQGIQGGGLWVPAEIAAVDLARPISGGCSFRVRADAEPLAGDVVRFDLALFDGDGPAGMVRGVELRRVVGGWLGSDESGPASSPDGLTVAAGLAALQRPEFSQRSVVRFGAPTTSTVEPTVTIPVIDRSPAPLESGSDELSALVALWREVLGDSGVHADSDFFLGGGHSLLGLRLVARIRRELGGQASLPMLVSAPSPRAFRALRGPDPETPSVDGWTGSVAVELRPAPSDTTERLPLHVVHGAGGNLVGLRLLSLALPNARRVVGYQANWVLGGVEDASIDAMTDRYVAALQHAQPDGPVVLAGYSGGGLVALEMAQRLVETGRRVCSVVLLDTVAPRGFNPPVRQKAANLVANVRRHGPRGMLPWAIGVVRRKLATSPAATATVVEADDATHAAAEETFKRVYDEHHLRTYDVDVLLVRAEQEWPAYPEHYGFGASVHGRFTVRSVAGDHFSMLGPNNLSGLGRVLDDHLTQLERALTDVAAEARLRPPTQSTPMSSNPGDSWN